MRILKPLARRSIAWLWVGQVLSATGSEFYMVAVVWIAAGLVGRDAGYVSALQAAALLGGSLFSGIVTDHWQHRTTMIAADFSRVALVLVLSLAGLFGAMSLGLLTVIAACVALAASGFDPALQATLPSVVPEPGLRHATNALFDATRRAARFLGPGMVALVNGFLPPNQFFLVTAATFLFSGLAVRSALRPGAAPPRRSLSGAAAALDSLLGGLRAVKGKKLLIYGLCTSFVGNVGWGMGILLGMILLLRQTSPDPLTDYSLMMTAYGAMNLAVNLVLGSMEPKRIALWLVVSKLIFGLGVFLLPLMPGRGWLMAMAAFTAINGPFETLAMLHLIHGELPGHRLAQGYRVQMCATVAGLLFAYLTAPSLFGWFGLVPTIMASGAATVLSGLAGVRFLWPRTPLLPVERPASAGLP